MTLGHNFAGTRQSTYEILCRSVGRLGGRIRLGRNDDGTVALTITFTSSDEPPRAIGFVTPLDELNVTAGLSLWWLTTVVATDMSFLPRYPQDEEDSST